MEAFVGRLEFDQTRASENLKYTPTIGAIVSDLELFSELVERAMPRGSKKTGV